MIVIWLLECTSPIERRAGGGRGGREETCFWRVWTLTLVCDNGMLWMQAIESTLWTKDLVHLLNEATRYVSSCVPKGGSNYVGALLLGEDECEPECSKQNVFFPGLQSSSFLASAGLHLDSMSALHWLQFATKQGKISHPDRGVIKDCSCMGSKGTRSFEAGWYFWQIFGTYQVWHHLFKPVVFLVCWKLWPLSRIYCFHLFCVHDTICQCSDLSSQLNLHVSWARLTCLFAVLLGWSM